MQMNLTLFLPLRLLANGSKSKIGLGRKIWKRSFASDSLLECSKTDKFRPNPDSCIIDVQDGAKILVGGYGLCGIPENMIAAILKKGVKDLTIVSNNCGTDNFGLGLLLREKRIKRLIASVVGQHSELEKRFLAGEVELELSPQGTLVERIRAGGAGIPAFFTPTAFGTIVQEGGLPIKYSPDGGVEIACEGRSVQQFDGNNYVLEQAITGDFAFIKAWKADSKGNLIFRKTARNFNPAMCRAAKVTIVEVEEICDEIDPDNVHVPGIYVDRLVVCDNYEKRIENLTVTKKVHVSSALASSPAVTLRDRIIRRAALECKDGMYVNLGSGLPTMLLEYIASNPSIVIQSETGMLGVGSYPTKSNIDQEIINGDKQTVSELPGASYFDSEESFAMIRGGHIDLAIVSAMEVSQYGDLASWIVPGKVVKGIGASMDIVSAPKTKVVVVMEHTMKDGTPKIVAQCNLPLTGSHCVDLIITEKAVFTVDPEGGLTLTEVAKGFEVAEILVSTSCDFKAAPELKPMAQFGSVDETDETNEAQVTTDEEDGKNTEKGDSKTAAKDKA